jgi:hypothetical protein
MSGPDPGPRYLLVLAASALLVAMFGPLTAPLYGRGR